LDGLNYHLRKHHDMENHHALSQIESDVDDILNQFDPGQPHATLTDSTAPPVHVVTGLPVYEAFGCAAPDCYYASLSKRGFDQHFLKAHESLNTECERSKTVYAQVHLPRLNSSAFQVQYEPQIDPDGNDDDQSIIQLAPSLLYHATSTTHHESGEIAHLQFVKEFRFTMFLPSDMMTVWDFMQLPDDPVLISLAVSLELLATYYIRYIGNRIKSQPGELLQMLYCRSL
jgi:Orsellinic acid/F9775 biosynthesis cluster protein D